MAAAGKGIESFKSEMFFLFSFFLKKAFPHQAPLALTFPGTAVTLQGPKAGGGSRETKVEGPRAVWKVLKEAQTDPKSHCCPSPFPPAVTVIFFFLKLLEVFLFSFLRQASVSFSIKQICNSAKASLPLFVHTVFGHLI